VSVVLIEATAGQDEPWHSHETEEVVAVTEGHATFFLGALQARIVRAGQVARIPAGVEHRWVNAGEGVFKAVAARAER
jgi:quercetin dioxygenase-like cupin family protein